MRKRRLSISYTFVTLIEGRWRNLLSLLGFRAFEVSFESSSVVLTTCLPLGSRVYRRLFVLFCVIGIVWHSIMNFCIAIILYNCASSLADKLFSSAKSVKPFRSSGVNFFSPLLSLVLPPFAIVRSSPFRREGGDNPLSSSFLIVWHIYVVIPMPPIKVIMICSL